ncbi:MAG: hypothetical protein KIT79_09480 [Deltaproteobacteria bacterium]|nr:hypothetical protein [Deltaproteobacteria bacterium]
MSGRDTPVRAASDPVRIETGVHLLSVGPIERDSYYADYYLWFRWEGDPRLNSFEIINGISAGNNFQSVPVEIRTTSDGWNVEVYRLSGLFKRYSDSRKIVLQIENTVNEIDTVVYAGHPPTLEPTVGASGWTLTRPSWIEKIHTYPTAFGDGPGPPTESSYSRLELDIRLIPRMDAFRGLGLVGSILAFVLIALTGLPRFDVSAADLSIGAGGVSLLVGLSGLAGSTGALWAGVVGLAAAACAGAARRFGARDVQALVLYIGSLGLAAYAVVLASLF